MILSLGLYLIAILCGLIFRRSKPITILMYSVMVLLAASRTEGSDMTSYRYEYYHVFEEYNSAGRYVGYKYFVQMFNKAGLEFEIYLIFFYCIVFAFMILGISRLTKQINPVLSFYMIFPYGIDVTQMKSILSESICFLGLICLFFAEREGITLKSKKRCIISFIVLELLAAAMHFASLFFLFVGLFFITVRNRKRLIRWIIVGIMIIVPLLYTGITGWILRFALKLGLIGNYDSSYMEQFFNVSTRLGPIIPSAWVILIIIAVFHHRVNEITVDMNDTDGRKVDSITRDFILTSALLIPFFIINIYFSRLLRVYMLLCYIILANRSVYGVSFRKLNLTKGSIAFLVAFLIANWMESTLSVMGDVLGHSLNW